MSATTTASAPALANRLARARPIPLAPPVTTITRPVTSTGLNYPRPKISASKNFLWKTRCACFRRCPIAHRISPHGRRGYRLQRSLSTRYRADRQALDRGRGESPAPGAGPLQPTARRHSTHQRPCVDRTVARAGDRPHRREASRPRAAVASELSVDLAWSGPRAGAGCGLHVGRGVADNRCRPRGLTTTRITSACPPFPFPVPPPTGTPAANVRSDRNEVNPAC